MSQLGQRLGLAEEKVKVEMAVSQPTTLDNQQLDQITQDISALSDDEALQALLGGG